MESARVVVAGLRRGKPLGRTARRVAGRVQLFSADLHPPSDRPPMSKDYLRGESRTGLRGSGLAVLE